MKTGAKFFEVYCEHKSTGETRLMKETFCREHARFVRDYCEQRGHRAWIQSAY